MIDAPPNPFQVMLQQAQEMARVLNPALESLNPKDFENLWPTMPKDVMEFWFGKTINKDGLDAKTRLFITLAGLTCQGAQADMAIRQTVRHLLEAEATKQEILEVIGQMTAFAGVPAVTRALSLAQEVVGDEP